jgi:hypothetical protein
LAEKESFIQAPQTKGAIREKFLTIKRDIEGILENTENTELHDLLHSRCNGNQIALQKEIQKSGNNFDKLPIELQTKLLILTCQFKNEVISHYGGKAIWWDVERFLHIFIRHIGEFQPDEKYKYKTVFQYDFDNIRKLVTAVIESVRKEIEAEFKANPTKNFKRQGERAVYYNGNYYRVEIEPNGRLLTFHPYNDDKEREKDNN